MKPLGPRHHRGTSRVAIIIILVGFYFCCCCVRGAIAAPQGLRQRSSVRSGSTTTTTTSTTSTLRRPTDSSSSSIAATSMRTTTPSVLLHDGFDSYAVGGRPGGQWQVVATNGSVTVDDTRSYSGDRSIRLSTKPAEHEGIKTAFLRLSPLSLEGNSFYARFMFWMDPAPRNQPFHWTFVQSGGIVKGTNYHGVLRYGGEPAKAQGEEEGGWRFLANYDTPDYYQGHSPGSDCFVHADSVTVPEGRWTCFEWAVDASQETADLRLWLDGTEIKRLAAHGVGTDCMNQDPGNPEPYPWTSPVMDTIEMGWESYSPDAYQRTVWIDDVIISDTRIGCGGDHHRHDNLGEDRTR